MNRSDIETHNYLKYNYGEWFRKPSLDIPPLISWSDWKWFANELLEVNPIYQSELKELNWERGDKLNADWLYSKKVSSRSGIYISLDTLRGGRKRYCLVYYPNHRRYPLIFQEGDREVVAGRILHTLSIRGVKHYKLGTEIPPYKYKLIGMIGTHTNTGTFSTRYGDSSFGKHLLYYPLDDLFHMNPIKKGGFINWPFENPLHKGGSA